MKPYKEFTFGWLIMIFMLPALGIIVYLYVNNLGDRPLENWSFTLIVVLFMLSLLLFYGLTTEVTDSQITVSFGVGLIRKRIPLERIRSIQQVENPWYYGWGIRFIPNGMLYNISGNKGIELRFNDTDRIVRIGSPHALQLKLEIEKRLGR